MNRFRKYIAWSVIVVIVLTGLATCRTYMHTVRWQEQVPLPNGRTLMIDRSLEYDPSGLRIPGDGNPLKEQIVRFKLPGTKQQITWKSNYGVGYVDALQLVAIEIFDEVPYVVAVPLSCHAYNRWDRPSPPYVILKYVDRKWARVQFNEFPVKKVKSNVLFVSTTLGDEELFKEHIKGVKRYQAQQIYLGNVPNTHYLNVETLKMLSVGEIYFTNDHKPLIDMSDCHKLVYDGRGGWRGLDWFEQQKNLDECLAYCKRQKLGQDEPYCPCKRIFGGNQNGH